MELVQVKHVDWVRRQDFRGKDGESIMELAKKKMERIDFEVNKIAQLRLEAERDPNLSHEGRRRKMADLADRLHTILDAQRQLPDELDLKRTFARGKAVEKQADPADMTAQLRQREIRDRLHALPPTERLILYNKASQSLDLETCHAAENAPAAFPLIPEAEIEKAKADRLQRQFPDEIATIEAVDTAERLMEGAIDRSKLLFRV